MTETYDVRTRLFPALLALGAACSSVVVVMQAAGVATAGVPLQAGPAPEVATASAASATAVPATPSATPTATIEAPEAGVSAVRDEQPVGEPEAVATLAPAADPGTPGVSAAALVQPAAVIEGPEKAAALLDLMNSARTREGLRPLIADEGLAAVARSRAEDLAARGYFDHYSPTGASAFSELAARGIGYRLAGENLARNNYPDGRTVAAAYEGLMTSPGHRANILEERFTHAGVVAVRAGRLWIYVTVFTD